MLRRNVLVASIVSALAAGASAQIFPDLPHAAFNFIPLGNQTITYHQVFAASQFGSDPIQIDSMAFAPNPGNNGQLVTYSELIFRLGYTDRDPLGLSPDLSQNPRGDMNEVLNAPGFEQVISSSGSEDFTLVFEFDMPWCYDPNKGNLLLEVVSSNSTADISTSRCDGLDLSSRAYNSTRFGDNADFAAQRIMFGVSECTGGLSLTVTGSCPGQMSVAVSGATPGGTVAFIRAFGTGSCVIPGGPCGGTQLGLSCNGAALVGTDTADANGNASISGNAPAAACGRAFVQALDVTTCTTSNVEAI